MTGSRQSEVRADVVLPVSAEHACDRMCALVHATDDSRVVDGRETDTARTGLRLVVGPSRRAHFPAKTVHATFAGPQHTGSTYVFELQWEPVGAGAAAYPTLDARVGITPVSATGSLLSIVARYHPPFGAVGAAADRAALSRVADATVTSVLHRLAHAITHTPSPLVGV
jgi:hypothetical protein